MNKLVSIIMPVYNSEKTLSESVKSVINQTYKKWELIIIDDHSTDKSKEIAKNFSNIDKRIVLLSTPANSGTATARNIGTENAKGRYIAFLDSDDIWKPKKLEIQVSILESNKYAFVYSDYDVLKDDVITSVYSPKLQYITYKKLLIRNDIGCLTVLYDVDKCGKIYMPLDASKREDYAAWLDVTRKGILLNKISQSLAVYRINTNSLTGNKKKMIRYHYRVYRNHLRLNRIASFYYLIRFMIHKALCKY